MAQFININKPDKKREDSCSKKELLSKIYEETLQLKNSSTETQQEAIKFFKENAEPKIFDLIVFAFKLVDIEVELPEQTAYISSC